MWITVCMNERMNGTMNDGTSEWMKEGKNNDWNNECMEWIEELNDEWFNKWMS